MALTGIEIARLDNGRLIIRPGGVRVRWELTDLSSSDGHAARAVFSAAVRALDEAAERKMLEEVFLAQSSLVTSAEVTEYFSRAMESAARQYCGAAELSSLLSDGGRDGLRSKLNEVGRGMAFGCGLDFLPPFELELDSPTWRVEQQEQRRSASNAARLTQAAALFKQFQEIRQAAPELTPGKILERMEIRDPAEQGEMLRSLLLSAANQTQSPPLWVVAGPQLIRIDAPRPGEQSPRMQAITLPETLGPLRSVQLGELEGKSVLLIGARSGVLIVDPLALGNATIYPDVGVTSALGFNAACIAAGKLWATHGEAGLVAWDLGRGDKPTMAIRPATVQTAPLSPRNLLAIDATRLLFSSDHRLFECGQDGTLRELDGERSQIIAILPQDDEFVLIIHENGELCRRARGDLSIAGTARRSGTLTAAGILPWLGSARVILATEQGPVLCVGLDDELITQYSSPHTGLRLATAAPDRIAAISSDRQRILLWQTWDGRKPPTEIHIAAIAKHRIADVEFGSS